MMLYRSIRNGFTMLEVIFVIIILGIVSSIGAEIIAQTYGSYIVQRAQYRANIKTELALTQIANRLRYAIQNTVVVRPTLGGAFTRIELVTDPDTKVLQWVGYDGDSFEAITSAANRKPGWSGFADISPMITNPITISSPGSNLGLAGSVIHNLGGSLGRASLYFAGGSVTGEGLVKDYKVLGGIWRFIILKPPGIPFGDQISERYKIAWSSYALEVDANNDLILHYGFAPVAGTAIAGGKQSILLHDVTNFRFKSSGGAFRLKICKAERISGESNETIHACKEKVVF